MKKLVIFFLDFSLFCLSQQNVSGYPNNDLVKLPEKYQQKINPYPSQDMGYPDYPSQDLGYPAVPSEKLGYPDYPSQDLGYPDYPLENIGKQLYKVLGILNVYRRWGPLIKDVINRGGGGFAKR